GVYLLAPATVWDTTVRQVVASTLYVQNWVLAGDSVDYSAQDDDATVAQHYWSLSIEEQFYVVWPLIILAVLALLRFGTASRRAALTWALVVIGAASLSYSVLATADGQATAYFLTPARVW